MSDNPFPAPDAPSFMDDSPDALDAQNRQSDELVAPNGAFIEIEHHPHSRKPKERIQLDPTALPDVDLASFLADEPLNQSSPVPRIIHHDGYRRPWAPFATRADFEAAAFCIENRLPEASINEYLRSHRAGPRPAHPVSGYQQPYDFHTGASRVTMENAAQLKRMMELARRHVLEAS
jgi:hypothetical protein